MYVHLLELTLYHWNLGLYLPRQLAVKYIFAINSNGVNASVMLMCQHEALKYLPGFFMLFETNRLSINDIQLVCCLCCCCISFLARFCLCTGMSVSRASAYCREPVIETGHLLTVVHRYVNLCFNGPRNQYLNRNSMNIFNYLLLKTVSRHYPKATQLNH